MISFRFMGSLGQLSSRMVSFETEYSLYINKENIDFNQSLIE